MNKRVAKIEKMAGEADAAIALAFAKFALLDSEIVGLSDELKAIMAGQPLESMFLHRLEMLPNMDEGGLMASG